MCWAKIDGLGLLLRPWAGRAAAVGVRPSCGAVALSDFVDERGGCSVYGAYGMKLRYPYKMMTTLEYSFYHQAPGMVGSKTG